MFSLRPNADPSSRLKSSLIKTQLQQVRSDKNVIPLSCQEPTPMEMFLYHSQAATGAREAGRSNLSLLLLIYVHFLSLYQKKRTWLS